MSQGKQRGQRRKDALEAEVSRAERGEQSEERKIQEGK